MRVLLAGGGTAGHVEPALNLAEVMRRRQPGVELAFLGTAQGLEARLVPARGYRLELTEAAPLPRRLDRKSWSDARQIRRGVRQARDLIVREGVDVVVGFGGYVAFPAYLGARGRCAIVVHEANARPGLANRVGARLTSYVAQAYEGSLRGAKTIGIPLRSEVVNLDRASSRAGARASFGMDPDRPCLLVFGGSQGARRINAAVVDAASRLIGAGWQILHVFGPRNADQVAALLDAGQPFYTAIDYLDRMPDAYAAADLAICRAGAMTCAELAAVGLPAFYIPLPIGNGEQRLNAAEVVRAGGGRLVADDQLTADLVVRELTEVLANQDRLSEMSAAAGACGIRDAADRLADMVEAAASENHGQRRERREF